MKRAIDIPQNLFGALKALGFLALVAALVPVALIWKRADRAHPFAVPQFFHKCVLRLLGIQARVYGEPSRQSPVLFVANHSSYLDIIVLGAILPAAFVAKSEVSGWPLFGFLSRVQNTVFIERRSTRAAEQRTQLQDHLAKKQNLILFPEGTSSDGLTALHFKSSLFSIVEDSGADAPITIQPVSITCTGLDGFPMLREERPLYAWYGDMTLPPHLWNVFKRGRFNIDVIFHEPMPISAAPNRKALAAACQELVARGIEQSLTGHIEAPRLLLTKE
ncbi:MAG: lysophospholipid acyltransferase family protein [Alphaproteobacteria bacterium]|nr:lysophospholipid acyltransferase family protein [Alphaproteobacteria bacterium]